MAIKLDQLTNGIKNHIDSTSNPHDVTAHQIGADAILAEIDEYGSTAVGWDKVDKTGSSLADLATRNYSDLSNPPGDDSFHALTEVSSSTNSDELLLYVFGTTNDYRKITKQNLFSGISVASNKIYQGNTKAEIVDTGSDGYFWIETEGTEKFRISTSGNVGIGQIAPTAKLHISAGALSAGSAPIKLTSGTAMSSPEDGAIEYHASHLYFTIGSTRYQIDQQSGGGGSGDVVGPSSATNEGIVRFDTTTGKLIQNSLVIIGDDGYVSIPSGQKYKINGVNLSAVDVGAEPTQTKGTISSGTASAISIGNGGSSTVGPNVTITISKASASSDGYLGKDNWTVFNNKQNALTPGTISSGTASAITIGNGGSSTVGPNVTVSINKASASFDGYLGKNDWTIFNSKQDALTKYNLTETSSGILVITGGTNSVITNNVTIAVQKASASQDGYLAKGDWTIFNGKAPLVSPVFTTPTLGVATATSLEVKGAAGVVVGEDAATNVAGFIKLWSSGTNSHYTSFTTGSQSATATYTLPLSMPDSDKVLQSTSVGVLSWVTPASSGANTALSNLSSVAINTTLLPGSNDGAGLGSGLYSFSDLFLATGAAINFNNGNFTVTHSSGVLTLSGTLALGANNLTMTGSLGATGARLTKGWFEDLQVTNSIAGSITGNAATVTGLSVVSGKTFTCSNILTLSGTDGSSLAIGAGGTLGTAAYATIENYATLATPIFTSKITIGVASSSTGSIELKGLTSGTCTITVPSVAGSPTYVLPASYGTIGQFLSDTNGAGILGWATASSGSGYKIEEGDTKVEVHDGGGSGPVDGYMFFNSNGSRKLRVDSDGMYLDGYFSSKGFVEPISSKSANYETTANDHTLLVTASSNIIITLSSTAAKTGQIYAIKKIDSGGGYVVLAPSSGTIDGLTTHSIKLQNESRFVQFDGTNWRILNSYSDSLVWKGTTTDAVAAEIFIDGVLNSRYPLTTSSTSFFELTCIARNNTDDKTKVWKIDAVTTTSSLDGSSIVGTPIYTVIAQSDVSGGTNDWAIAVSVDDTYDKFRITITGEADKTIQWVVSN